jgi:hypothetical protein
VSGRFEILAPIGPHRLAVDRGAAAPRAVVLATVPPEVADDAARLAPLAAEVEGCARLFHPNVLAPVGLEGVGEGLAVVHPHRDGATVRELLDAGGRLPADVAARIGADACAGLAYVHGRTGAEGRPLAHGALDADRLVVTPEGDTLVSGFCAAPEPATPAGDLRALGAVLHECLAGEPPPRKPRSLEVPGVPPALAAAVVRALAGEGSAEDLGRALLAAAPTAARESVAAYADAIAPASEGPRGERRRLVEKALGPEPAQVPAPRPRGDAEEISEDLIVGEPTPIPAASAAVADDLIVGEITPDPSGGVRDRAARTPRPADAGARADGPEAAARTPEIAPASTPVLSPAAAPATPSAIPAAAAAAAVPAIPAAAPATPSAIPAAAAAAAVQAIPAAAPATASSMPAAAPAVTPVILPPPGSVAAAPASAASPAPVVLGERRLELEGPVSPDHARTMPVPAPAASRRSRAPLLVAAVMALVGLGAGLALSRWPAASPQGLAPGDPLPPARSAAPAPPVAPAPAPPMAAAAAPAEGPAAPPPPAPEPSPPPRKPAQPSISVTADPPGEVYVDGKRVGRSPVTVNVSTGHHEVRLKDARTGIDVRRKVEVRGPATAVRFVFGKGWLDVTAPSEAIVYVDGRRIGTGNVKVQLVEGDHRVEVRLGQARASEQFQLIPGQTWTYEVTPTP